MARHLRKCKWCEYGSFSYKYGEWECWRHEKSLTFAEAKKGCNDFRPNRDCPNSVCEELGLEKKIIGLFNL